jgi:adenine specific DNA methylase mod
MEKMRMESMDLIGKNVEIIGRMFPNCVVETSATDGTVKKIINFDMLRQMLSEEIMEGDEAYEFTWVGKKASIVEANRPIRKTLRPCVGESEEWNSTNNMYIEGDNLEVLKLLQESYLGKIKMIYIDPPYNTGHDFIYPDSFIMDNEEYANGIGYYDENGNVNFNRENNDTAGKYHSDWCSMIYSRLLLSRNLLRDDGVIFISIDDKELNNLMKICNEIFGEDLLLACFPRVTKKAGKTTDAIAKNHDYVLAYSKTKSPLLYLTSHMDDGFKFSDEYENERGKYKLNQTLDYDSLQYSPSLDYPITIDGETIYPGQSYEKYLERQKGNYARADWAWRWSRELFDFGLKNGFIVVKKYNSYSRIYTKTYQNCKIVKKGKGFEIEYIQRTKPISTLEFIENEFSNDNSKKDLVSLFESSVFDYSKPVSLIKKLVEYSTTADDVVLDFFSGSATTAQAVMQANAEDGNDRQFILVQLAELCSENSNAYRAGYKNICEIGKQRMRLFANKLKGSSKEMEHDLGFRVFKLDDSNMNDVYYSPAEYSQNLLSLLESNVKSGRTDLDLLFGCLLEWGLPLSLPYSSDTIEGYTVHNYNEGDLIACFDENIPESVIKSIAKKQPLRAVFRDSSFSGSPAKINVSEIFKLLAPETSVKVI